jgi:hypothetical protein
MVQEKNGDDQLHRTYEKTKYYILAKEESNWTGHVLCGNWLLEHVTEGKIERIRR